MNVLAKNGAAQEILNGEQTSDPKPTDPVVHWSLNGGQGGRDAQRSGLEPLPRGLSCSYGSPVLIFPRNHLQIDSLILIVAGGKSKLDQDMIMNVVISVHEDGLIACDGCENDLDVADLVVQQIEWDIVDVLLWEVPPVR